MLDEAVGATEARGPREHAQLGGRGHGLLARVPPAPATSRERNNPETRRRRRRRGRRGGMRGGPRKVTAGPPPMAREEGRERHRIAGMRAYAPRQRLDAPQHEPAV